MTKKIINVLWLLALIIIILILGILWYFNIFNFGNMEDEPLVESPAINSGQPLSREEQRNLLEDLAPVAPLTDSEKQDQINLLEDLQQVAPEENAEDTNTDINIFDSLNADVSEEEQLKLLESLKN